MKKYYNRVFCRCKNSILFKCIDIAFIIVKAIMYRKNCIFLLLTPNHGNLGDHAITLAEVQLVKELFNNVHIIEIPSRLVISRINYLKCIIKDKKILIQGGGFIGDLWECEDDKLQFVLRQFPSNHILIFPQTIYYNRNYNNERKDKLMILINEHRNIWVCVREEYSYSLLCDNISKDKILLLPDIVLYLKIRQNRTMNRSGLALCLRKDKEKKLRNESINRIIAFLEEDLPGCTYEITDTVLDKYIGARTRYKELAKFLEQISLKRLILTDRLHGMIFATLTKTPCIVFSNSNNKVKGVYKWIKENNYIYFYDEVDKIKECLIELYKLDQNEIYPVNLSSQFEELKNILISNFS